MEEKVTREVAEQEINDWLDYKRVDTEKRTEYEDNIEVLVKAMMYGDLTKDDEGKLVQTLIEPIGRTNIEQFKYKTRVTQGAVMNVQNKNKVKTTEHQAFMACYIAAITDQPYGIVKSMVTEDWRIAQSIVLFFT